MTSLNLLIIILSALIAYSKAQKLEFVLGIVRHGVRSPDSESEFIN